MRDSLLDVQRIIGADPAVRTVAGFAGGGGGASNSAFVFLSLKPRSQPDVTASQVVDRLRAKLAALTGASTFL